MSIGDYHVESGKGFVAGAATLIGNALCWAQSIDIGLITSLITGITLALAGGLWVLAQSYARSIALIKKTNLDAEIERERAMAPSISKQLEALQRQMKEEATARDRQMKEEAAARETMSRQLAISEEEKHRLLLKLTDTVDSNTAKIDTIKDAVQEASGPRVLIVEDDKATSGLMVRLLKAKKYRVDFAANVPEAINKLLSVPTFIVLDVMLPGGSGFDVLREVRKRRMDTKVIMCSALDNSDPTYAANAGELMPDFTLRKPPDYGLLIAYLADLSQPRPHLSDLDLPRLSGDDIPVTSPAGGGSDNVFPASVPKTPAGG